jgi:prepilin-type N-terminal cleavage/methylation domain-containing protein
MKSSQKEHGFTLIELLTVIAIIAILMGLLFSAMGGVRDAGNKTKAKNDVTQIVTAVKAYYTEYGKYPCTTPNAGADANDYQTDSDSDRTELFSVLMGRNTNDLNPRLILFMEIPPVKKDSAGVEILKGGADANSIFYDPWGGKYTVRMDTNYNNTLLDPYANTITVGTIAWSLGKDKKLGTATAQGDDIVSWQ